jgi:hypothetical protein
MLVDISHGGRYESYHACQKQILTCEWCGELFYVVAL